MNPEEFTAHGDDEYQEFLDMHAFPPDWKDLEEVREPTVYTRCPDCGQYTCVCANKAEGRA